MATAIISHLFRSYRALYPEEIFPILERQLQGVDVDICTRKNFMGHVVADGCVIDPKNKKILLIHHKILDKWLKPGWHIDEGEEYPSDAARREVFEETGVRADFVLDENREPLLLHIDSHIIPENVGKWEPEHWHHAMTFLFLADSELPLQETGDEGIIECQWFDITDVFQLRDFQPVLDKIELF